MHTSIIINQSVKIYQMGIETLACCTCSKVFHNRTTLNAHVKRDYQRETKVRLEDGTVSFIQCRLKGLFECPCSRERFISPLFLHRYAKRYSGQAMSMTEEDMSTTVEFNC